MTDGLLERFAEIKVWTRGDERAPHKPLLILLALGAVQRGEPRLLAYADVDAKLRALLEEFGPVRKTQHPEYPFWHLLADGIWDLQGFDVRAVREKGTSPSRRKLLDSNVHGGFTESTYQELRRDPRLLSAVAYEILDSSFPESLHQDIEAAVGLDLTVVGAASRRKARDPSFRDRVLIAYESRCTVCGFSARIQNTLVGLEAAHIKWHQAGGPDAETNGLALCVLHHKLFDRGAFTVAESRRVEVSQLVTGGPVTENWLLAFHGRSLREPQSSRYRPDSQFIDWHRREVFRSPARE
jgi:putative restriction endonuclease